MANRRRPVSAIPIYQIRNMTVAEFIERLGEFPSDKEVRIKDPDTDWLMLVVDVVTKTNTGTDAVILKIEGYADFLQPGPSK